jgi:hypothetical protein
MDAKIIMTLVIGGLGLVLWGFKRPTDGQYSRSHQIALLVLVILIALALVAYAVLVAIGVVHVAAWREPKTYLQGLFGVVIFIFAVGMLFRAVRAPRRPL